MEENEVEPVYTLSQEESKRIGILKFISIVLVVYIHAYNQGMNFADSSVSLTLPIWLDIFENVLSQGIARMAVPMFFLISAVLLFKHSQNYKCLMLKKTKRLLIPYLFWNTLWILLFIILQQLDFTKPYFSKPDNNIVHFQLLDWLNAYGVSLYHSPFLYPLWFMRDLIIMTVLYPLFNIVINRFPYLALGISVILIFIPNNIPFNTAIAYFFLGGCIVKFNWRIETIDRIPLWLISLFYILFLFLKLLLSSRILNILTIFIGIVFFIRISKYIYYHAHAYSVMERLVPYTFIIYAGHELTLSSLKKVCLRMLPQTHFILFSQYFILPLFVIAGCIFAGYILKSYFGKVYKFITGEQ